MMLINGFKKVETFVDSTTLFAGTLRNNSTQDVGFKLTVGSSPITIVQLGRWIVSGNTGSHVLKIISTGSAVLASATLATSGKTAGAFAYVDCVYTLSANTVYYIMSAEVNAGDQWYDPQIATITSNAGTVNDAAYTFNTFVQDAGQGANRMYGPLNFKFRR